MRRATSWVACAIAIVMSAGCTGAEPGEPVVTSTPAGTNGATLPGFGAPEVEHPLDITHFTQEPCDTLNAAQIDYFLGSAAKATPDLDEATGPTCNWTTTISGASIHVGFPELSDEGLTTLYRDHEGKYAFFNEMPPAAGYPTVAYDVTDNREQGQCPVRVGVSDRETVDITLYLSDNKVGQLDPCDGAHEVATAVIGNIKARN